MLKKYIWRLFATIVGMNFKKEYEDAVKLNTQMSLKNMLFHAYENVPYYHNVFRKVGVMKNGKLCLANFDKIPILTKEIIRRRAGELISRDYGKRGWFYNTSGGSTGEPVNFIQDRLFTKWILVTSKYYENILGVSGPFAKKIILWDTPRESLGLSFGLKGNTINNALTNTILLDVLFMSENDMERYVRVINSFKPEIIRGYANSLYEICKFVEKTKMTIHTPTVVVSTAEVLHDYLRKKIEAVFGTKVYDFYGSREVDGIAGECKNGLLHIFMFNNFVEVLDKNKNEVKEGENGKVIVTTLHNYSMPLIRYEIGDMAVLGPEKCKCGNPLPTLKKVAGRVCCFFRRKDGTIIDDGYFIGLFTQKEWVKAFRIIQEDYTRIRIMIIPREGTTKDSEKRGIEEKIELVMGKDCKVTWEVVDEIPKTKSGKYLYTQSLLSE